MKHEKRSRTARFLSLLLTFALLGNSTALALSEEDIFPGDREEYLEDVKNGNEEAWLYEYSYEDYEEYEDDAWLAEEGEGKSLKLDAGDGKILIAGESVPGDAVDVASPSDLPDAPDGSRTIKSGTFNFGNAVSNLVSAIENLIIRLVVPENKNFDHWAFNYDGSETELTNSTNIASISDAIYAVYSDTTKVITDAMVEISGSFNYTGSPVEPDLTVSYNGETLQANQDYEVTYSDNVNVGTAKATITGKGSYGGEVVKEFEIVAASLETATITLDPASYSYDGAAKTPAAMVTLDGKTLAANTDYTVAYSSNTDVGTATVTITGKGNYTGTKTASFTIGAASLADATVSLSPASFTYDGAAKTPAATVTLGGKTLAANTDYTVAYSSNTDVGTATVTITGKGNYTGTKTASFTIGAASLADATVSLSPASFTYDGAAKTPAATVTLGGKTLAANTDYTVAYSNNTAVGTATVTITGKGSYTGTKTASFTIGAASLADATVSLASTSFTYDGTAKTPSATVTLGGKTLAANTDYTIVYSGNTAVGTATVTITGKGSYTGTKTASFTIGAASLADATVSLASTSFTYDGTAKTPSATVTLGGKTLAANTDYTIVYSGNTAVGTATVTITGKGGYTGTKTASFTISAAEAVSLAKATVKLAAQSYAYDGKAKKPAATVTLNGKTLKLNTDYTVSYSGNTNIGTATVTITGKGDYKDTKTATFTITAPAKGKEFTVSKMTYKVTNAKKYTVSVNAASKKTVTSVTIPASVKIGGKSYKVVSIASGAFKGYSKLKKVTIGSNVTSIGSNAFNGCKALTAVTIPKKVTSIGASAFEGCTALKTVTLKTTTLKTIGSKAFKGDKKLTAFDTGAAASSIGSSAFEGCTGLKTVVIGKKVKTVGAGAFAGCTALSKLTVKSTVLATIGDRAFKGDKKLKSFTVKDTVTSIGDNAFENCVGLASVTIGKKVKSIGASAFAGCTALKTLTSNSTALTTIGKSAFNGDKKLTKITFKSAVIKTVGAKAFTKVPASATVKVPKAKVSAYKKLFQKAGLNKKAKVQKV